MSTRSNEGSRSRAGSAVEPTAKKARKLTEADLGGPIEDEETAKRKLADAGFDPVNLTGTQFVGCPDDDGFWMATPMDQFCAAGDLKMIRYLSCFQGYPYGTCSSCSSSLPDADGFEVRPSSRL